MEIPQHDDCLPGESFWCKYQVDIATGGNTYQPVKEPIPPAIQEMIKPVFSKLGDEKFLEACKNIVTSNVNESYHHVLWDLALNEVFCSTKEIDLVINLTVCIFNSGFIWTYENVFQECNVKLPV